jgi:hypothetical protein
MDFGERLDAWLVDVAVASRWLLRLYTRLQDPTQRMRAERLERAAVERLNRRMQAVTQTLQSRESLLHASIVGADEAKSEQLIWHLAVKGVCGIAMLYRFGATQDPSLARLERAWTRALRAAVEGYVAAFPIEIARGEIESGFLEATQEAVDATQEDLCKGGGMTRDEAGELAEGMRREFLGDLGSVLKDILRDFEG